MSAIFRPQLAASKIANLAEVTWPKYMQPKFDGICCIAKDGKAYSRSMKLIPNEYIQDLFNAQCLHGLHGELILQDSQDFNDVQSAVMRVEGTPKIKYIVFDTWNNPELDYNRRLQYIEDLTFGIADLRITGVHHYNVLVRNAEDAEKVYQHHLALGYEGSVLKDPTALYKNGRCTYASQACLKLKPVLDAEGIIVSYAPLEQNIAIGHIDELGYARKNHKISDRKQRPMLGSIELLLPSGVTVHIGSGFTEQQRILFWKFRDGLLGKQVNFTYQQLTKYNIPRAPIFKGFRKTIEGSIA